MLPGESKERGGREEEEEEDDDDDDEDDEERYIGVFGCSMKISPASMLRNTQANCS